MTVTQPATTGRRDQRRVLGALFVSSITGLFFIACGISLGSGASKTELFKRLTVEGDFHPGGPLGLRLEFERQYPVPVDVACDVLDPNKKRTPTAVSTPGPAGTPTPAAIPRVRPTPSRKVFDIVLAQIPANAEGGPAGEATPVAGTLEQAFQAPAVPGTYVVRCYTPRDENNVISTRITISPATPVP